MEKLRDRNNDYLIRDENPMLLRYSAESRISAASFMVGKLILIDILIINIYKKSKRWCLISLI